jgi:hypothetical protein
LRLYLFARFNDEQPDCVGNAERGNVRIRRVKHRKAALTILAALLASNRMELKSANPGEHFSRREAPVVCLVGVYMIILTLAISEMKGGTDEGPMINPATWRSQLRWTVE